MSNIFVSEQSKYPRILTDERRNVPSIISSMGSTEQSYDMLHHSHYMEDLISKGEGCSYEDIVNKLNLAVEEIARLTERITNLENSAPVIGDYDVNQPGIQNGNGETITAKEITK